MSKLNLAPIAMAGLVCLGCAEPVTFFSKTQDPTRPGKVHFMAPGGVYSTVSIFKDARDCRGIQRVAFFASHVDETIYVPYQKYLTFSVYAQTPGISRFQSAGGFYSVPFESGELRVILIPTSESLVTRIERNDPKAGWTPVQGIIKRTGSQPFLSTGPWCEPAEGVQ